MSDEAPQAENPKPKRGKKKKAAKAPPAETAVAQEENCDCRAAAC